MPPKLRPPKQESATRCRRFMGRLPPAFTGRSGSGNRLSACRLTPAAGSLQGCLETTFSVIARFFYFKVIIYPSPRICKGDFGRNSPLFCFPKSARGKNFSVKSFSCTLDSFFKPQKGRGPFAPPANIISPESDCRRQRRCRCCESSRP